MYWRLTLAGYKHEFTHSGTLWSQISRCFLPLIETTAFKIPLCFTFDPLFSKLFSPSIPETSRFSALFPLRLRSEDIGVVPELLIQIRATEVAWSTLGSGWRSS
jgi:hypothetical protein